jgi:hypothetical protein
MGLKFQVRDQCIYSDNYFKSLLLGKSVSKLTEDDSHYEEEVYLEVSDDPVKQEIQVQIQESEIEEVVDFVVENDENIIIEQEVNQEYESEYAIDEIITDECDNVDEILIPDDPVKLEVVSQTKEMYYLLPQCSVCGKIYKNTSSLNAHEKTHFKRPIEKVFQCDLCGDKFTKKGNFLTMVLIRNIILDSTFSLFYSLHLSPHEL